jgi:hypoxanthine-guanine phosphoribosyltransferase
MSNELIVAIITAVTTSILGPIAVHYAKAATDKRKKDQLLDSLEINQMINDKLEQIKKDQGSDRIWLIQFHNGGNFYPTGKSIQKFSIVYELVNSDIVACQSQFQSIPVSLFSKSMHALHKGFTVSVPDTSIADKQFEGFTSVVYGASVKSTYMFPLFNIKDEFIGIVGLDYVHKKKDLKEKEITDIDLEISTIGGVLNNYLTT